MKRRAPIPSVSHEEWIIDALRSDPQFAVEYLKQAMEGMNDPEGHPGRRHCSRCARSPNPSSGVAKIAAAGRRDSAPQSLYRALSPKGNPYAEHAAREC